MTKRTGFLCLFLLLPFLMAHGDGGCGGGGAEEIFGPPTQSTCPTGSTLTFANFGQTFMTNYCTRCHSSELSGAARNGAPKFHDYETLSGVKSVSDHIDQTSASGPAATNNAMPPSGPFPTDDERKKLGEWIACGAP
jgi:cytochrome c5